MKLHLPIGLRRALYHTFIALLTGAAAMAGNTMADVTTDTAYSKPYIWDNALE